MEMRHRLFAAAAAAALSLGLAGTAAAQDYPEMNLKLAHFVPTSFPGAGIDQWYADEIAKRSGGKIKIQIYWAESMGKAMELLDLVGSGAVDMAATAQGYFPSQLPLTGMTNSVMMLFDNNEDAVRITVDLIQNTKAIQAELKKNNIYPVFFHSLNAYRPFCSKKIEKIEDFKGLKMRAWGEYVPILWQSLGATGVNVLTQELYEALQRNTIDCAFWPHDIAEAGKIYEVAKFAWDRHFGAIPTWPLWVNWNTWHNEWPESVRKLMTEVGKEAMERDIANTRDAEQKALDAMVSKHGVQVVKFQDWDKVEKTVPDLTKVWLEKMKAKGLGAPAQELVDSLEKQLAAAKAKKS